MESQMILKFKPMIHTECSGRFEISLLGAVGFEFVAQTALLTFQRVYIALQVIHGFFEFFLLPEILK